MAHEKKSQLLGMSFGTARARLDRDILFVLAVQLGHKCYRCNGDLVRDNFSVDHKDNWSIAENPKEAYFDLNNIAFSHSTCNAAFHSNRKYETEEEKLAARRKGYINDKLKLPKEIRQERRRQQYLRTGK